MRILLACYLASAPACAANRSQLPAPSSLAVDPLGEVIAIPPGTCRGLDDHFALSANALRAMLVQDVERETQHRLDLAQCMGSQFVAEAQRDRAIEAVEHAGWWHQWAPMLIAGASVVGLVAGAALGVAIGGK